VSAFAYQAGSEVFHVNKRGEVSRPAIGMSASGSWRITGAVRFNNFGYQVERMPFPACMGIRDWRDKNGKPRWHLCDLDHGTHRVQMSPGVTSSWVTP